MKVFKNVIVFLLYGFAIYNSIIGEIDRATINLVLIILIKIEER
jgi:hypothetical protein